MPKEYTECVKGYLAKGKTKKYAQRRCAISYYKRHGKTPQQAHGASTFDSYENELFEWLPLIFKALEPKRD